MILLELRTLHRVQIRVCWFTLFKLIPTTTNRELNDLFLLCMFSRGSRRRLQTMKITSTAWRRYQEQGQRSNRSKQTSTVCHEGVTRADVCSRISVCPLHRWEQVSYFSQADIEITAALKKKGIVAIENVAMTLIKKYHSLCAGMFADSGQLWKHGGGGGGGGRGGYVASAFILILISSSTTLPAGLMCFQDWIDLDFWAEVGELRLNLVKLGDNQVLKPGFTSYTSRYLKWPPGLKAAPIRLIIKRKHVWKNVNPNIAFFSQSWSIILQAYLKRQGVLLRRTGATLTKKRCVCVRVWQEASGCGMDLRLFLPPPHLISITSTSPSSCNCDSDFASDSREQQHGAWTSKNNHFIWWAPNF